MGGWVRPGAQFGCIRQKEKQWAEWLVEVSQGHPPGHRLCNLRGDQTAA